FLKFGNVTRVKEDTRSVWTFVWLEQLAQDIRFALRSLRKSPGFTAVAILTLALGIGANTAIFSVIDAVLLRSLPYPHVGQLVILTERLPRSKGMNVAMPDFLDWQTENHSFEEMAAFAPNSFTLNQTSGPVPIKAGFVSWTFFSILGVKPILGRTFAADEDKPGGPWTGGIVISYSFWRNTLHGDMNVIGKSIQFKEGAAVVIGVLPPGFQFPGLLADVYNQIGPLARLPNYADRSNHPGIRVLARLKPGISLAAAHADMDTIMVRLGMEYPKSDRGERAELTPIYTEFLGNIQPVLLILFGAAGSVLLLACANVANLFLARSATRRREMALRAAIGASRIRLLRQLFTESLLLSLLGAAAGLLLAYWAMKPLLALAPRSIPNISAVTLNTTVLCFTIAIAVLTAILFGLAPSLQAMRVDLNASMKNGPTMAGPGREYFRSALLIGEIAAALVLVVGAGLLIRSLSATLRVDPGFNPDELLTFDMNVVGRQVNDSYDINFYGEVLRRIRAMPGVRSAAAVMQPPVQGLHWTSPYIIEGQEAIPPSERPWTAINMVTSGYFQTMQTRLLEGRFFTESDNAHQPLVVILNQTLAKRLWPNESAVGKRIYAQETWRQVIGVVEDTKQFALNAPPWPETYLPFQQMPLGFMTLVVRADGSPANLVRAVISAVHTVDKNQSILHVAPMTQYLDRSTQAERFSTYLLSLLGLLALLLAAIGTYGLMAYTVAQRTHEVGVRMALGATSSDVLRLIIWRGAKLAFAGVVIGIGAALALTRLLGNQLFAVRPTDPATFAGVSLILVIVALVACYIPARRAMRVDPMTALRYE
ncbi:MAG TPA: ABC transporter permease, partial [Candidatus Acidoferrales bacterium]|nr:ABC transporter permease [Candidatus Acidoferrales bacterium]